MLGRVAAARVSARDAAAADARRSSPRRRSCSCSRSRRSGSRCCSPTPAHATLEVEIYRQAVELFDLRTAAALALVQIVAVLAVVVRARARAGAAGGRPAPRRRGRLRPAPTGPGEARGRRRRRGDDASSSAARSRCWSGGRCTRAGSWSLSSYRALGSSASTNTLVRLAVGRGPQLARVRGDRDRDRVGGRRPRVGRDRRARGRGDAELDTFLMLPLGTSAVTVGFGFLLAFQHAPERPRHVAVARADRARGRRDPVRRARGRARAAQHRSAAAGRGDDARCGPAPGLARGRPADRGARVRGRGRVLRRGLARRVRRDAVHRPARLADGADRDPALPRPAR